MCGRYTFSSNLEDLKTEFSNKISSNFSAKYNISPGQESISISIENNEYYIKKLNWGFKITAFKNLIINARSETLNEKKIFKELIKFNRCLIPANSWFEWCGSKKPYLIKNKNKKIISFAALKRVENNGDQKFIIITSQAIGNLKKIHNRTPAIINREDYRVWLGKNDEDALSILKPIDDKNYYYHPVSPDVGKTSNDNEKILDIYEYNNDEVPLFPNLT